MVTLGGTVAIELQVALPVWQLRMKCALGSIGVTANSRLSVVWGQVYLGCLPSSKKLVNQPLQNLANAKISAIGQ
jgi:hypothetical protein